METKTAQTEIAKRIITICESERVSINEFSKEIGFTGSTIYAIIDGVTKSPRIDLLIAICKRFNVNANWLILGTGEMRGVENTVDYVRSNDIALTEYLKNENMYLRERLSDVIGKLGKYKAFRRLQAARTSTVLNASLYQ